MTDHGPQHQLRSLGSTLHGVGMMVSFALLALAGWGVVAPLESQRTADLQRCQHLDRLIAAGPDVRREHDELQQELDEVRRRKEELRRRITDGAGEGEFLNQVSKVADDVGVRLKEYRPGAISHTGQYGMMRIELNCTGSYDGLCSFLEQLDKLPRLATIDRLEISSPSRGESCTFKLSLDIYFASGAMAAIPRRESTNG